MVNLTYIILVWMLSLIHNVFVVLPLIYKSTNDYFSIECEADANTFIFSLILGPMATVAGIVAILYMATIRKVEAGDWLNAIELLYAKICDKEP